MLPKDVIKIMEQLNPDEDLLITWWGDSDWKEYKDKDQAYDLAELALDVCIGHVNDYVSSQYQDPEESDE